MTEIYPRAVREGQKVTIYFGKAPPATAKNVEFEAIVDCDEFGDPTAIEVRDASEKLGTTSIDKLRNQLPNDGVRFSYDDESDVAVFGLTLGHGTRYLRSAPRTLFAQRDERGLLLSLAFEHAITPG